jgi:thymidine kinase
MFLEPHYRGQRSGWIEAICGSMFSGKTEELIRRLRRAEIAGQAVGVFKPETDSRYAKNDVVSHEGRAFPGRPVKKAKQVLDLVADLSVVGLDEAQFFDEDLPKVCEDLADQGKRVIVAGLDMDFRGMPFGPMPQLLAVAEYITKVHAICAQCGNLATHSFRTSAAPDQVLLGASDAYEARCRRCFRMGAVLPFKQLKEKTSQSAGTQQKLVD